MSELKWGIEITVPMKAKGLSKEVLFSDKTGTRTFTSKAKAAKFKNETVFSPSGTVTPNPRVVRVKVTVSRVKPKPKVPALQTSL